MYSFLILNAPSAFVQEDAPQSLETLACDIVWPSGPLPFQAPPPPPPQRDQAIPIGVQWGGESSCQHTVDSDDDYYCEQSYDDDGSRGCRVRRVRFAAASTTRYYANTQWCKEECPPTWYSVAECNVLRSECFFYAKAVRHIDAVQQRSFSRALLEAYSATCVGEGRYDGNTRGDHDQDEEDDDDSVHAEYHARVLGPGNGLTDSSSSSRSTEEQNHRHGPSESPEAALQRVYASPSAYLRIGLERRIVRRIKEVEVNRREGMYACIHQHYWRKHFHHEGVEDGTEWLRRECELLSGPSRKFAQHVAQAQWLAENKNLSD